MRVAWPGLTLAIYAIYAVDLERGITAQASTSSLLACGAVSEGSVGDGSCDSDNNNEECEYDGGDCCPCTCEDNVYLCGVNGYDCRDPRASDACATVSTTSTSFWASTGLDVSEYPNCSSIVGYAPYIGDGFCDSQNNNEECGYDGGDCCLCTCLDHYYVCGVNEYDCLDPTVPVECANATSPYPDCTGAGGYSYNINDGWCHPNNNIDECGYDGGDCCDCTCVDSQHWCGINGYDCLDPTVPVECANETSPYPNCTGAGGLFYKLNDGLCEAYNNIEECGYDGGDCCACTCFDSQHSCGVIGYDCLDPTVPVECVNAISPYQNCSSAGGYIYDISDGSCDSDNNIKECGYDGGDCCACTCVDSPWLCGVNGYDCLDPTVPVECVNAISPYQNCSIAGGNIYDIRDGWCHKNNNVEECGYDGGDCCPCTCVDSQWSCGVIGYDCLDPTVSVACANATSTFLNCTGAGGHDWKIMDGYCDAYNNIEECGYDGGDCCACTCVHSPSCGGVEYNCLDPRVPVECVNATAPYPNCSDAGGFVSSIANAWCDVNNNNEECGYDGGDCCLCTCKDAVLQCGIAGYSCLDPTVPYACAHTTSMLTDDDGGAIYPDCEVIGGDVSVIGSGYCTSINNNQECGYDGGDCCPCTCVSGSSPCGSGGYDCQDPTVAADCSNLTTSSTNGDDGAIYPDCEYVGGDVSVIGSGYCTRINNNEECGYDGGDCCPCTCFSGSSPCGSGGYDCQDPTVPADCSNLTTSSTNGDDGAIYPDCEYVGGDVSVIGSGYCTRINNNEECGYDGGDCCPCTCFSGSSPCGSGGYDCRDPTVPANCSDLVPSSTYDDFDAIYPGCGYVGGDVSAIGSGYCTSTNNNEECGYDGGDCCPCTCVDGMSTCGSNGYDCRDPTTPLSCFEETSTTGLRSSSDSMTASYSRGDIQCMGEVTSIGNGICDVANNNVYCEYDGGDCCSCTCFDPDGSACGDQWYDCQDPGAKCSEALGTIGVAIITGFAVVAFMLCCWFVPRLGVFKWDRGRRASPKVRLTPPRPEAVGGVFEETKVEKKVSHPKLSNSQLPVSSGVKETRVEGKRASGSKSSAPPLPPLPECCALEEEGVEEKKAWDPKPSVPPLPPLAGSFAVEEEGEEEKISGFKPSAPPSPLLPERCAAEEEEMEEEKTSGSKPSGSTIPPLPGKRTTEKDGLKEKMSDSETPTTSLRDLSNAADNAWEEEEKALY